MDDKEDNDVLYEVMSGDDRTNNDVVYEVIDGDDKIEEPKKSMMFDSVDEVLYYYVKYAKQEGFAVVKRGNNKKKIRLLDTSLMLVFIKANKEKSKVMLYQQ